MVKGDGSFAEDRGRDGGSHVTFLAGNPAAERIIQEMCTLIRFVDGRKVVLNGEI